MNRVALLLMAGLLVLCGSAWAGEGSAFLVVYPSGKYVLPSGETPGCRGQQDQWAAGSY